MILPSGAVLRGVEQIKPLFVGLWPSSPSRGRSFNLSQKVIDGEIAYITWSAETADNVYEFAKDTSSSAARSPHSDARLQNDRQRLVDRHAWIDG